jgi:hypothetical protein
MILSVSGFKYNQPEYVVSMPIPRSIVEYPTIIKHTFEAYVRISMVDYINDLFTCLNPCYVCTQQQRIAL